MKTKLSFWGTTLGLCLSAGLCLSLSADAGPLTKFLYEPLHAFPDTIDTASEDLIQMIRGELVTLDVHNLTRISLTDPGVADIIEADESEILVVGRSPGETAMFLWDDLGKRVVMIRVVERDLDATMNRIEELLTKSGIDTISVSTNKKEGKVVLSGKVSGDKKEEFNSIIDKFGAVVWNLTKEENIDDLVQIDLQITELNTTLTSELGISWGTDSGSGTLSFNYEEQEAGIAPGYKDLLKIGDFQRTTFLIAKVNALVSEGKGRILSQPKLVVVSGEEARFLVGGETPIRTSTVSTGGSTENVEFKEFGIGMTITPTIVENDRIDLEMTVEVSDIDTSANNSSGDVGFNTRSAQTKLNLDNGQTIMLAGLIRENSGEIIDQVPFVSKIPVIGALFRSVKKDPGKDEELVISVTPVILTNRRADAKKTRPANVHSKEDEKISLAKNMYYSGVQPYQRSASGYTDVPREMDEYVRSIQRRISQSIVYPQEAKDSGWEGTVKLNVLILRDGTLAYAFLKESSGYELFDEIALNAAKSTAPYSNFPPKADLQELNVTIPIVYSLKRN